MSLMTRLRDFNADRATLDEMLELHAGAKLLKAEYVDANLDVPDDLDGAIETLDATIKAKSSDILRLRLKEIEQAEAGLQTAAEKRQLLAAQKEKLLRRLGKVPEPVAQ